ncbi:hypothetical protein [Kitasatospora sp. NPDC002040]|uniref:hypothetical protein n=1 Tax=Kitasatospora sp. NPDC002040 TaxID=3154661 RepID=UPI00331B2698
MRLRRTVLTVLSALALLTTAATGAVPSAAVTPGASVTAATAAAETGGGYTTTRVRLLSDVELEPGAALAVQVSGASGLPAGLASVTVNVAAKGSTDLGRLVLHPSGEVEPDTGAVSYDKAHYAATTLITKVGSDGKIKLINQGTGSARIYLDVHGYTQQQGSGLSFVPLTPQRILAPTTVGAGGNLELKPLGLGGVPATGVQAVALTVTVKSATTGTIRVYPAGEGWPADATLDYAKDAVQQNFTVAKIGTNSTVNIHNLAWGGAEVAVDVAGYFTDSTTAGLRSAIRPVNPVRIAEKLVLPANGVKTVDPRGVSGVPVLNSTAVGASVTAFGADAAGAVQVYPSGGTAPAGSTVNYLAGLENTGFTLAKLGSDGKISLRNTGTAPVTVWVDVYSYAELVDRVFPAPAGPGEAIENITGTADLSTETSSDAQYIAVSSKTDDSGTTTVRIPRDPQQGVTLTSATGATATFGLPATGTASRTAAGTVLYSGTTGSYSVGVQPTADGGFRTFAHLNSASAPSSYAFPVTLPADTHLAVDELDGSALIVREHVSDTDPAVLLEEIGRIQKPWARDAAGRTWPTSYTVQGNTLTLNIDLTPAAVAGGTVSPVFPVVADPSVNRNCGIITCSWYFSKATTRWIKDQFDRNGWTVATASGIICARLGHPVAVGACAIAIAYYYNSAYNNTRDAYNRGGCLVVRVNIFWSATPYTAWRTVRFDNVPLSNRYCYAS